MLTTSPFIGNSIGPELPFDLQITREPQRTGVFSAIWEKSHEINENIIQKILILFLFASGNH